MEEDLHAEGQRMVGMEEDGSGKMEDGSGKMEGGKS